MKKRQKITSKLLVFIFIISFSLILGSFAIFYFYGKSYLKENSIKELSFYTQLFEQATKTQLLEYNNNVDASFYEIRNSDKNQEVNKNFIKNIITGHENLYDQIFFEAKGNNFVTVVNTIKVFGGKHIINIESLSKIKYKEIQDSINSIIEIKPNVNIGISRNHNLIEFSLIKENKTNSIVIKINGTSFFEDLLSQIYHSPGICFSLIDGKNVIQFSTNKYWVNQRLEKFLSREQIVDGFYETNASSYVCKESENKIIKSKLLITSNITKLVETFTSIIYKLLFYSVLVFLFIVISTIFYAKRISKSLNKITNVAESVGEGDFSKKIMIKRNDEFGLLINSFNKMVDNLDESYSQLNLTNEKLEQKIEELIKTKTELTKNQKLALIGETISKISHEIQNKISGVSVWVQNLEMQENLDESTHLYVNEIKRSLNSFVEMLHNFKKFYRKPFLEKSIFNYSDLLMKVINLYKADITAKKIRIIKNTNFDKEQLIGDENLLEEAIVNIFVNAIYFTPIGGNISISVYENNNYLETIIIDDGPGIDVENCEKIFNPFHTTKSSGSGLGLAITKNIIEAHNGTIEINKNKSIGAEFRISIPLMSKI